MLYMPQLKDLRIRYNRLFYGRFLKRGSSGGAALPRKIYVGAKIWFFLRGSYFFWSQKWVDSIIWESVERERNVFGYGEGGENGLLIAYEWWPNWPSFEGAHCEFG